MSEESKFPALETNDPVGQLVADGVLVHVGWQLATNSDGPWAWRGTHPHFFDDWDDEQVAFHITCNPVFVRRAGE